MKQMQYEIVKGKFFTDYIKNKDAFNEIETKVLANIRKIAIDVYKVKVYLLDHFLYQTITQEKILMQDFSKETWYFSSLETGFYQLATNLIWNLLSEKKDKQVSIDYLLGQLIENAKMNKLPNLSISDEVIKKLELVRSGLFDENINTYLSNLKKLRDGNTAHHDINYSHPKVIKIREVYELYYKINNSLVSIIQCLSLSSDALYTIVDKQFLYEINSYLNKNGIYK